MPQYTTHGIMPPLFGLEGDCFGQVRRQVEGHFLLIAASVVYSDSFVNYPGQLRATKAAS